jgi:hypothetical protein
MKAAILLALSLALVGCATPVVVSPYTTKTFPPNENAQILHALPKDRPYIELGELSFQMMRTNQTQAPLAILEKAKAMGADAVVILDAKRPGVAPGGIRVLTLTGIAIRYERDAK